MNHGLHEPKNSAIVIVPSWPLMPVKLFMPHAWLELTAVAPGLVKNVGVSNFDEPALRQMHQLLILGDSISIPG